MAVKKPTPDQMRLAADWCESNDGDESKDLAPVVKWLREFACKIEFERELKTAAKQTGQCVQTLRWKLRPFIKASHQP